MVGTLSFTASKLQSPWEFLGVSEGSDRACRWRQWCMQEARRIWGLPGCRGELTGGVKKYSDLWP